MRIVYAIATILLLWGCDKSTTPGEGPLSTNIDWNIDTIQVHTSIVPLTLRIRATGSSNVYIVGHNHRDAGIFYRYDGTAWRKIEVGNSGEVIADALLLSDNNVIAVGYDLSGKSLITSWNGISWSQQPLQAHKNKLTAIGGTPASGIWAGGYTQTLYYFDGTNWTLFDYASVVTPIMNDSANFYVHVITDFPDRKPFMITHDNGPPNSPISSIWSKSPNNTSWDHFWDIGSSDHFYGLWPTTQSQAFIGTPWGFYQAYNDGSNLDMIRVELGSPLWSFSGNSNSDLFAVGDTSLFHYDGITWTRLELRDTPPAQLTSVWTSGPLVLLAGLLESDNSKILVFRGYRR